MTGCTTKIVLDEMAPADLDSVVDIERQSFDRPWTREHFLREIESAVSRTIVTRDAETRAVVGYVCRWLIADEVQILNLAVRRDYRRRGIARRMLERVLDEARGMAVRSVMLEVREGNAEALALYESAGFARVGRRRDYYGEGEAGVLMTLLLPGTRESKRT